MAEPNSNRKLAERLIGIGEALRDAGKPAAGKPAAKVSAELVDFEVARREQKKAVAAAEAFLEQTEAGQQVVNLLRLLLGDVGTIVCAHDEKLAAFERRLAQLEERGAFKYCGVWDASQVYHVNDFCTDDGSLFACMEANCGVKPGSSSAWRLACKRGRDGRDKR